MKLKIIDKKVFIDDKEIINVSKLSIHKEFKMPDRIVLEFYVDEVEESSNESNNKQNSNITVEKLSEKPEQANINRLFV